jgi:hypothetical protein
MRMAPSLPPDPQPVDNAVVLCACVDAEGASRAAPVMSRGSEQESASQRGANHLRARGSR